MSRDKIIALLWPESDTERARNSLSHVLSAIRREFNGNDPIIGTTELRLREHAIASDIATFESAVTCGDFERAVSSYGGPFLDGFFIKDAAGFEQWTEQQRARLHEKFTTCLTSLAEAAAAERRWKDAARWWGRFAALDPGNAQAVAGVMQARPMCASNSHASRSVSRTPSGIVRRGARAGRRHRGPVAHGWTELPGFRLRARG